MKNDLLSIEVGQNCIGNIEVLCRLLSRFEGIARCKVSYWVLQEEISYTNGSATSGTGLDILPVILSAKFQFQRTMLLQANAVGGIQDVTLDGYLLQTGIVVFGCRQPSLCLFYMCILFPNALLCLNAKQPLSYNATL